MSMSPHLTQDQKTGRQTVGREQKPSQWWYAQGNAPPIT